MMMSQMPRRPVSNSSQLAWNSACASLMACSRSSVASFAYFSALTVTSNEVVPQMRDESSEKDSGRKKPAPLPMSRSPFSPFSSYSRRASRYFSSTLSPT